MEKATILYIDDEPINLMLFGKIFGKKYHILTAESGFKGLDALKDTPEVDLVISDMKMPKMNGLEFISKAKSIYPNIHYTILTGYEISIQIQDALNNGLIRKYFRKPYKMNELEKSLDEILMIK